MVRARVSIDNLDRSVDICLFHLEIDERVGFEVFVNMGKNEQLSPILVQQYLKLPKVPKIGATRAAVFTVERSMGIEYNPFWLCLLSFI